MKNPGYALFCPVSMACLLLEPRWTMLILCEMFGGSERFSDIQRGVPGMSPSLLSRRLKEMQENGLIERVPGARGGQARYVPTPLAEDLAPILEQLGDWAHRNLDPEPGLQALDPRVLMWNLRRKVNYAALPPRRSVVKFTMTEPGKPDFEAWLLMRPGQGTDLCMIDPKDEVDLFVQADLRSFTAAFMGHSTFAAEIDAGRIELIGDAGMARSLSKWLIRSTFSGDAQPMLDAAQAAE
jgi:DNA-binding HxlR family transcriptional regulator